MSWFLKCFVQKIFLQVFKKDFRLNVVGRIGVGGGKRYEILV